jgi:hypothetical protein
MGSATAAVRILVFIDERGEKIFFDKNPRES